MKRSYSNYHSQIEKMKWIVRKDGGCNGKGIRLEIAYTIIKYQ